MNIRLTRAEDIPNLETVLDATELFPSEMLSGMLSDFLAGETGDHLWLTCEDTDGPAGFCYSAAEQLADGTWNMLAIAVDPEKQGAGFGTALVHSMENQLREKGHRILIVDTSGTEAFAKTRKFYLDNGYTEEARIRDFWGEGDDKVIYWKQL